MCITYNGGAYIADQIRSIQNQDFEDWELLVRDDGSTDGSPKLIAKLAKSEPRINLLTKASPKLGFNRNYFELMRHAGSDYIMFADQDDIWDRDKVSRPYAFIKAKEREHPAYPVLVHCDSRVVGSDLQPITDTFVSGRARGRGLASLLLANSVQEANVLLNRGLLGAALEFEPVLPYDYYLGLIAESIGIRVFLNSSLMSYRQHANNAIGAAAKGERESAETGRFS